MKKQYQIGQVIDIAGMRGARVVADVVEAAGYAGDEVYVIECYGCLFELANNRAWPISYDEAMALPKQYRARQRQIKRIKTRDRGVTSMNATAAPKVKCAANIQSLTAV
ncbi:MAG: hypothetical protein JWP38_914 [Herbaspirillum sp.]|nr:hypothetical protein [Herbaspirillum sp.]